MTELSQEQTKSKNSLSTEQKAKEAKFSQYKNSFSEERKSIFTISAYQVLTFIVILTSLAIMFNEQQSSLEELMDVINVRMQLQESRLKENSYRAIDIGMLSNMHINQINVSKMSVENQKSLFDHVIASIRSSFETMKLRHQVNPYLIRKTIRTENFWSPSWINSYSKSFEMLTFETEMTYL